jgi:hypothetical protein
MPPPEHAFHAYPPTTSGDIRPLGGLAVATSIMLGLASAVALFGAVPLFQRAKVAAEYTLGSPIGPLDSADNLVFTQLIIMVLVVLATAIVFIVWQYRYAVNAVTLGGPIGLGPGWAIGGWFIPLANFVLPFLQVRQSTKASLGKVPAVVTFWTIAYIAGLVIQAAGSTTRPKKTDTFTSAQAVFDAFAKADRISAVGMIVYAAAGVIALLMVRSLTVRQQEAAAARQQPQGQGWSPQPPQQQWGGGQQPPQQQWGGGQQPPPPPYV